MTTSEELTAPVSAELVAPDKRPSPRIAEARGDVQLHWTLLIFSLAALALSLLLQTAGEQRVSVPLVNVQLPEICTYKRVVGRDCPGCGLTRSFISLAHGDVKRAWQFNPAGVLLFLVVISQVPYRAMQLWRLRTGRDEFKVPWLTRIVLGSLFAALLLQWLLRLIGAFA
jgi:hypothetical protein